MTEIKGEIADVIIMILQLTLIYEINPDELGKIIEKKLDRQKERIKNHEN